MRILIGTLYCGENEYLASRESIHDQSYRSWEHKVFSFLPGFEAHRALYTYFQENRDRFDLLVKLDADMVLGQDDILSRIVDRFTKDEELDLLLIPVHDFFTGRHIIGLNVFRNTVRWHSYGDMIRPDMTHDASSIRTQSVSDDELAGAILHAPNPSREQAFRYGFARGVKTRHGGGHWDTLRWLVDNYRDHDDPRLAIAILGASEGLALKEVSRDPYQVCDDVYNRLFSDVNDPVALQRARASLVVRLTEVPVPRHWVEDFYRLRDQPPGAWIAALKRRLRRLFRLRY